MKRLLTISISVGVLATTLVHAAPQSQDSTASDLIAKSRSVLQALKSKDPASLKPLLTDDFRIVSSDGKIYGKGELVGAAQEGVLQEFLFYNPQAMPAGNDSAIVTYNVVLTMPEGDEPGMAPRYQKISDLWVRQGDDWRLKFEQATPLRPID